MRLLPLRPIHAKNPPMEDMIIELQEALAHQSDEISQLSKELYTQQREVADLRDLVKKLETKLKAFAEGQDDGAGNLQDEPPPPHY